MFNLFNLGHALPLRFRRFSCYAWLRTLRRASEMLCCIRSLPSCEQNMCATRIRFLQRTAARSAASSAARPLRTPLPQL